MQQGLLEGEHDIVKNAGNIDLLKPVYFAVFLIFVLGIL